MISNWVEEKEEASFRCSLTPPRLCRHEAGQQKQACTTSFYLLAALGGDSSPCAKDIKKIVDGVSIEADDDGMMGLTRSYAS